jgi:hypothetical protein
MKTNLRLLAVALIAGGTMFAQSRLSIGIGAYGMGAYPPPAYTQYQPPCPGPGYTWVDGYWAPREGSNAWIAGFWRAPAVAVAPRYIEPRYHNEFRGNDRDHDSFAWNHGGEGHDNRGNGRSRDYRR